MPRIRSVKPEYFTHPKVQACSIPARLLFISMWTQADEAGRMFDQPRRIAGDAFGENDDVDCAGLLEELDARGLIIRYSIGDRRLIQVHDFDEHQRLDKRLTSKLPAPPAHIDSSAHADDPSPHRGNSSAHRVNSTDTEQGAGSREQVAGGREQEDRKEPAAFAAPDSPNVGTPLGEVLTSTPPPPAPGLSEVQDGLVKGLREFDPVWHKLTFGAVNKLNRRFGRPVVVMALQRAREERAVPATPFPWLQSVCESIDEKAKAAAGA